MENPNETNETDTETPAKSGTKGKNASRWSFIFTCAAAGAVPSQKGWHGPEPIKALPPAPNPLTGPGRPRPPKEPKRYTFESAKRQLGENLARADFMDRLRAEYEIPDDYTVTEIVIFDNKHGSLKPKTSISLG